MIPTRHWPAFERVFAWYTAGLLRRRFHAMWVRGNLPTEDAPLVMAVQHIAWWDPLVLFHLSRTWFPSGRYYVMMDEANLRSLSFFRWIGAFGVDRSSRSGAAAGVRYALDLLAQPRARVVLFPQGLQRPMDVRPLRCEPGAGWLAARAAVAVVPVALRYEFLEDEHPDVFVSIGAARAIERRRGGRGFDPLASALESEADALRDAVYTSGAGGFTRLLRGRGNRDPLPAPGDRNTT